MFDLLVRNYKEDIYGKRNERPKMIEIMLIILVIVSGFSSIVSISLGYTILEIVSTIILITVFVVIIVYINIRDRKQLEANIDFKKKQLKKLKGIITSTYGLYSIHGLNLIIKNCNNEIKNIQKRNDLLSLKSYITTIIYPIVLASLGAIVSKVPLKTAIELSVVIINCILWITYIWMVCVSMYKLCLSKYEVYNSLKKDAEFLLVELQDDQYGGND